MGIIRNTETDEVVFESDNPAELASKANEVVEAWRADHPDESLPFAVEGFDSGELEDGTPRDPVEHEPPPDSADRVVVDAENNTVTVYGDASAPPVPDDWQVTEA